MEADGLCHVYWCRIMRNWFNIGAVGVGDGALSREFTHIIVSSNPLLSRYNKQTYVILSLYCKYGRLPPKKLVLGPF